MRPLLLSCCLGFLHLAGSNGIIYDKAFAYRAIESHIMTELGFPKDLPVEECQKQCWNETACVAWELCSPLGDGCNGCYLVSNTKLEFVDHRNWASEIIDDRMAAVPEWKPPETIEQCENFLLNSNGGDEGNNFHSQENLRAYSMCGQKLRSHIRPKNVTILGQHHPTLLVTNFRDPKVLLPEDVERELTGVVRPRDDPAAGGVSEQLHEQVGTKELKDPDPAHAFLLPFYDTNIGHWIKQYGSMNVLQSYEMQSLLRSGDVVIDVGANLGSYTIPFAEKIGPRGVVLAFEPFRWLYQMLTANVALNGLANVWTLNMALGDRSDVFLARPPQFRFFSSPGGMKVMQDKDGDIEKFVQMYDFEAAPEEVTLQTLDAVLSQKSLRVPHIQSIRLIKIDVEDMEKEVILGARAAILQFKPIVWTENVAYFSSNGTDMSFIRILDDIDYQCGKAQNSPNDLICVDKHGRGHQIDN